MKVRNQYFKISRYLYQHYLICWQISYIKIFFMSIISTCIHIHVCIFKKKMVVEYFSKTNTFIQVLISPTTDKNYPISRLPNYMYINYILRLSWHQSWLNNSFSSTNVSNSWSMNLTESVPGVDLLEDTWKNTLWSPGIM